MENKVKLHGACPSPFSQRVIWALELKGIKYDYIEEDLTNKSSMLLKYNPIYKKIPVLVHNENPICESIIIIEYLEEMWPHQHPLLPKEPSQRAMLRFWAMFANEKGVSIWMLFRTTGEDHTKAKDDTLDMLSTIEENFLGNNTKFFGGEKIGIVDIIVGSVVYWLEVIQQIVEVKLFEANKFPKLDKWFKNFKEDPIIRKNLPDQNQMYGFFNKKRNSLMEEASM